MDDSNQDINNAFIQEDVENDSLYHVPVDVTKYEKYYVNTLQPNVVYYEVVQNPDGSYYYINNQFKGITRNGRISYENKYGDDLLMEARPQDTIFVKAYDLHRENYNSTGSKESDFLAVSGIDDTFTDMD